MPNEPQELELIARDSYVTQGPEHRTEPADMQISFPFKINGSNHHEVKQWPEL